MYAGVLGPRMHWALLSRLNGGNRKNMLYAAQSLIFVEISGVVQKKQVDLGKNTGSALFLGNFYSLPQFLFAGVQSGVLGSYGEMGLGGIGRFKRI